MQTSGLVLDVFDDVGGEQLRAFFPSQDSIPDFVKQAHVLDAAERSRLPDDVFALVLVNGDETLRKYACIDEGNTSLSVVYFLKNAHKLPAEARQRCAENLKVACAWYDLAVPEELEKEAGLATRILSAPVSMAGRYVAKNPLGAAMTAMTAPSLAKGTAASIKENLGRVNQAQQMGGSGLEAFTGKFGEALAKIAEISGTDLAPISASTTKTPTTTLAGTIKKSASVGRLPPGHGREDDVMPDTNKSVAGEAPKKAPQHMNPVVVVTDSKPHSEHHEKKASRYALPSKERYPLDNYGQVKQAAAYFEEYGRLMPPSDRREYCVNLVKRASDLRIPVSDTVRKYGSGKYASAYEIEAALDTRRALLSDPRELAMLDKLASSLPSLHPDTFVNHLQTFDGITQLTHLYDSAVMDPYYSTYGFEKMAEDSDEWSDVVGNEHITARELKLFALNHWMSTKKIFGLEFAEEFHKDPIAIYKSLPVEQKRLVIRLAQDNAPV